MEVEPEMKPEPAGGAYNLRSAFESPRIPSAWTVLKTCKYQNNLHVLHSYKIQPCIS
jgi:hypothetical protein